MEVNVTAEALKFMVLGMGVVFIFLIIMIYALKFQAYIISKYFPDEEVALKPKSKPQAPSSSATNTAKIAAIVAAVQHHNNQKG